VGRLLGHGVVIMLWLAWLARPLPSYLYAYIQAHASSLHVPVTCMYVCI